MNIINSKPSVEVETDYEDFLQVCLSRINIYISTFSEFEHPVEAVQSISMLHNQTYYDRKMSVRMDRVSEKQESTATKLPPGLKGLGMGLGINGSALTDVASRCPFV